MQGKEVKAVLFDLDGVLVDSLDAWSYVFNDTLKHFGHRPLSIREFIKDFGAPIEHDVKKYFKVVITMDDVKKRKPAPDMILRACKKLRVNPKNTILIGDTRNDMLPGRRAGCITVGYKVKGDYRIKRLKSIIKFIK